jgi:ADP-ribose pyrophosphatase
MLVMTMENVEVLAIRSIHEGKVLDLSVDRVRLPNGEETDLEMVHHRGAAAVLPVLADGRVLLVRQFRYPTGGWLLEVPAGKLDPEEEPGPCARRELEEETGWRLAEGGELIPLGWIWTSPGFTDEKIWLYLARGLEEGTRNREDHEVMELEVLGLDEAVEKARRGEIHDAKTVCALLRAKALCAGG